LDAGDGHTVITENIQQHHNGMTMPQSDNFSMGFYFHTLTRLLEQPRRFFMELGEDFGWKRPLGFLLVSSLFFAGAGLVSAMPDRPVLFGGIFFVNAVGMALIAALAGYGVMVMFMGKRVTFARFFSIYALSSGVTLLAAWIPFFIWLTEPWKWWLIATGMTRGLGFSWWHTLVTIGISVTVIFLFFWSVWPVVLSAK
jgi:hypothetical protein